MQESGNNIWPLKKAYEVAYASFRIAAKMGEQDFAAYLKKTAIAILGSIASSDNLSAKRHLAALEYLIRFAMDVSIMGIVNGDIMLREIAGLNEMLADGINEPSAILQNEEAEIAGIFSEVDSVEQAPIRQNVRSGKKDESGNGAAQGEINGILKSAIRQSAILERIRQVGNCRIKDIQEILPDSSERTIRYDLQTMAEQNLIERVGTGGPSVYYRIRPGETSVI